MRADTHISVPISLAHIISFITICVDFEPSNCLAELWENHICAFFLMVKAEYERGTYISLQLLCF